MRRTGSSVPSSASRARKRFDPVAYFNPAVMTIDVGMKGIDGAQAIKLMREDPELSLSRVIAVTAASTSKKKRAELSAAGADVVVDKPLKGADLVKKIGGLDVSPG